MKYLKYFESKEIILYKNDDFVIRYCVNNILSYSSKFTDSYAIPAIPELIRKKSKYLSDEKLRDIKLRDKDIKDYNSAYFDHYLKYIENIKKFHSGILSGFFGKEVPTIPDDVYITLTLKYYPLLKNVVKNSKTIGDIIDGFTPIYKQLMMDLPLEITANKYNI